MSVEDRRLKIDALIESVPPVIRPMHGADSCILSSNVGRELLRDVGIEARMTPVRVAVFNRQMREIIGPNVGRLLEPWTDEEEARAADAGARSVMIGWREVGEVVDDDRFVGHVVLAVRNPDGLIDLTLDQAARGEKDIYVEPCFFPLSRGDLQTFLRGDSGAGYVEQDHGTGIAYGAAPDLEPVLRSSVDVTLPTLSHRAVHAATLQTCRRAFRDRLASVAAAP